MWLIGLRPVSILQNQSRSGNGPLLFVVFINDLPDSESSSVKMIADDTKVYQRSDITGATTEIQNDIDKLQRWSDDWFLRFHPQKCSVLKLGAKKSDANYYMKSKDANDDDCILQLAESEA
jgi:hypothetical protein